MTMSIALTVLEGLTPRELRCSRSAQGSQTHTGSGPRNRGRSNAIAPKSGPKTTDRSRVLVYHGAMLKTLRLLAALATLSTGSLVYAHHAGSMFDESKPLSLTGTVREFQFTNPHCYIQLVVPDTSGTSVEWSIEMGAPAHLFRAGWKPMTLKPGDSITVTIAPLRSGGNAGQFKSAVWPDGKPMVSGR